MLFRTVLGPIIRINQWSGLSPFPSFAKRCISFGRCDSLRFATITAVHLLMNFILGIQNAIQTDYNVTGAFDRMIIYGDLLMALALRLHAFTVLIESYTKRSIQLNLMSEFDEIENIFAKNLNLKSDEKQLRQRFWKFIAIWFVKLMMFSMVLLMGPLLTFEWYNLYYLIIVFIAFYSGSLSFAQWLVYVDVIRYNIERLNVCLVKMNEATDINRFRADENIFFVRAIPPDAQDMCERLDHLRKCFSKVWQASILINQSFRWSFLIGIGSGVFIVVFSLYSILFGFYTLQMLRWYDYVVCIGWTVVFSSDFFIISMICEQINAGVSISPTQTLRSVLFHKSKLQVTRMLYLLHQIPVDGKKSRLEKLVNIHNLIICQFRAIRILR